MSLRVVSSDLNSKIFTVHSVSTIQDMSQGKVEAQDTVRIEAETRIVTKICRKAVGT